MTDAEKALDKIEIDVETFLGKDRKHLFDEIRKALQGVDKWETQAKDAIEIISDGQVGHGDNPISFLIASHIVMSDKIKRAKKSEGELLSIMIDGLPDHWKSPTATSCMLHGLYALKRADVLSIKDKL